jgi:hypothetical protein
MQDEHCYFTLPFARCQDEQELLPSAISTVFGDSICSITIGCVGCAFSSSGCRSSALGTAGCQGTCPVTCPVTVWCATSYSVWRAKGRSL